jgi:hypothetical protein
MPALAPCCMWCAGATVQAWRQHLLDSGGGEATIDAHSPQGKSQTVLVLAPSSMWWAEPMSQGAPSQRCYARRLIIERRSAWRASANCWSSLLASSSKSRAQDLSWSMTSGLMAILANSRQR